MKRESSAASTARDLDEQTKREVIPFRDGAEGLEKGAGRQNVYACVRKPLLAVKVGGAKTGWLPGKTADDKTPLQQLCRGLRLTRPAARPPQSRSHQVPLKNLEKTWWQ